MAKKRKRSAKAAKTAKASATQKAAKKKFAKKKTAKKKTAVLKTRRKIAPAKTSKSGAKGPAKKPAASTTAKTSPAKKPVAPPPESLRHRIADAVGAVVDIFTDAERLHHKLEPDISNEPE